MKTDIENLTTEFERIKKLGWVKSMRKGTSGIGYTFERLIGKPEDYFNIPDYNSIEIKTKHRYSKGFITLFSAAPDGDTLFPIKRIVNKYGYPDKDFKECNIFNIAVNATSITKVGYHKKFKINVNYEKEKIDFVAIDRFGNEIDTEVSWSFDMLKEKLERKLQYLSIVKADSKIINGTEYLKYYEINFYKLKNFYCFLKLIENGIIIMKFKIGVFKKGPRKGKMHDRGTSFDINEKELLKLYEKISN